MDNEHSTRFENLIYRALSSGLITESKAADNGVVDAFAYLGEMYYAGDGVT